MKRWSVALALALIAAGCSGMSEDDPAYPYQDTRWLSEEGGAEIRMNNGKATWISYGDERREIDLTYTVNERGNVVFHDESQEAFKKDIEMVPQNNRLISPVLGATFSAPTEESEARFMALVAEREEANKVRNAPRPATLNGYRTIRSDQLLDVLASHMEGQVPDDNLAAMFVEGYSDSLDGFAKRDLIERELPKVKARLAELKKQGDFQIKLISHQGMLGAVPGVDGTEGMEKFHIWDYDFEGRTFPVSGFFIPCHIHDNMSYGTNNIRGAKYVVQDWGIKGDAACRLTPKNEQDARRMEEARQASKLQHTATVYFRITGQKIQDGAMLLDVHRVDVQPYDAIRTGFARQPGEYEAIGGPITLMAPAGGAK